MEFGGAQFGLCLEIYREDRGHFVFLALKAEAKSINRASFDPFDVHQLHECHSLKMFGVAATWPRGQLIGW